MEPIDVREPPEPDPEELEESPLLDPPDPEPEPLEVPELPDDPPVHPARPPSVTAEPPTAAFFMKRRLDWLLLSRTMFATL
jgi:hypothetical protein